MQDNNKHPLYLSSLYLIKFMTWRLKILSTTFNEWEKQREKIIPDLMVETHLGARRNVVSWHNFFEQGGRQEWDDLQSICVSGSRTAARVSWFATGCSVWYIYFLKSCLPQPSPSGRWASHTEYRNWLYEWTIPLRRKMPGKAEAVHSLPVRESSLDNQAKKV